MAPAVDTSFLVRAAASASSGNLKRSPFIATGTLAVEPDRRRVCTESAKGSYVVSIGVRSKLPSPIEPQQLCDSVLLLLRSHRSRYYKTLVINDFRCVRSRLKNLLTIVTSSECRPRWRRRSSCGAAASASRRKSETESVHCHCDARRREVRRRLRRKDELRRCAQALMQIRLMKALHVPRSYSSRDGSRSPDGSRR